MKSLSKSAKILIILACTAAIIAMVFVATRDNLGIVVQEFVCDFCTTNGIDSHPSIGRIIDKNLTVTHNPCTVS